MPMDDLPSVSKSFNPEALAKNIRERQEWSKEIGFQLIGFLQKYAGLNLKFDDELEKDEKGYDGWYYEHKGVVHVETKYDIAKTKRCLISRIKITAAGKVEYRTRSIGDDEFNGFYGNFVDVNGLEPIQAVSKIILALSTDSEFYPSNVFLNGVTKLQTQHTAPETSKL